MAARAPRYRVIVAGIDFSRASMRALNHAFALGHSLGARVHVVYVAGRFEPALPFSAANRATVKELRAEEMERATQALRKLIGRRSRTKTAVLFGRPSEEILAYARRVKADLIVLTDRGQSAAAEFLIGSTAHRVLHHSSVPVLLVPGRRASAAAPRRSRTRTSRARR